MARQLTSAAAAAGI